MKNLSAFEVSLIQLERSIRLSLDEKDYVSSITLAGAAEEILGKLLQKKGGSSSYEGMKAVLIDIADKIPTIEKMDQKEFNAALNGARNTLKHLIDSENFEIDAEQESNNILHRAIENFAGLTGGKTELMQRWYKEIKKSPKYMLRGRI